MRYIYAIKNKAEEIIYVGKTNNPVRREQRHRSLNKDISLFYVIETVEDKTVNEREFFWINKMIKEGEPIRNRENPCRLLSWIHTKDLIKSPCPLCSELIYRSQRSVKSGERVAHLNCFIEQEYHHKFYKEQLKEEDLWQGTM